MFALAAILIASAVAVPQSQLTILRFMPTSEIVQVASMAARDEGFNLDAEGIYLNELRRPDGEEPIGGYASIGLYKDGHPQRSYAIRVDTGDVVETELCEVLRFPDLLKFKKRTMLGFNGKDVSLDRMASEVGCNHLKIITHVDTHPAVKE